MLKNSGHETKKTKHANLENKKWLFFQVGLLVSLGLLLIAFEWKVPKKTDNSLLAANNGKFEDELVENTFTKDIPQEPPKPEIWEFIIHDNNDDIISDALDFKLEIGEDDAVGNYYIPMEEENVEDEVPFWSVATKPSFRGEGYEEFVEYVQSHVIYSDEAIGMGIQGRVVAHFAINKEGYVVDVRIMKGVDPLLDDEVIKVLENSPRWKPGKQRNIPVKVTYTIPVFFRLSQ